MRHFSKRHFLQFLQCPKLAYTAFNNPEQLAPVNIATEYRMKEGRRVEEYARQLFPEAQVIDHQQPFDDVLAQSQEILLRPTTPICNALLSADEVICETDILVPVDDEWDLYEVKSSSSAKPEHFPDLDFQRLVARKQGIRIRRCHLILINTKYIRKGAVNPKQLFKVGDITGAIDGDDVDTLNAYNEERVESLVDAALVTCHQKSCPDISIGEQCTSDCPLRNVCWKEVDARENNIFSLYLLHKKRAWGWYRDGITNNEKIPNEYPLNDRQRIQVAAERSGDIHINRAKVGQFCNQLQYPLYLLDFETFASPIPLIQNTRPYENIPFQFSLHIIGKDLNNLSKEPRHDSWIWEHEYGLDPRLEMLGVLRRALGNSGSIVAYNAMFEKGVMKSAVKLYPDFEEWLEGILERFVDLLTPFRSFSIYHPKQHGSCSLKSVLPALTGQDYSSLAIQDGEMASRAFMGILNGEVKGLEKEKIIQNLENYCGLDTLAMVEILRKMKGMVEC